MENTFYKIYKLEDELNLYTYRNSILKLIGSSSVDDEIDKRFTNDFREDFDLLNETEEVISNKIKRYQKLVKDLKVIYGRKCQLCGYSFDMDNGNKYCEAHHIKELSKGGSQSPLNVLILCSNHHRLFHYASNIITIDELVYGKRRILIGEKEYLINLEKSIEYIETLRGYE